MAQFHPINRNTSFLFPPPVQEGLPERHLARHIAEVVEGLDLSDIERAYSGSGSTAYHPATLMSLLNFGYATGFFQPQD